MGKRDLLESLLGSLRPEPVEAPLKRVKHVHFSLSPRKGISKSENDTMSRPITPEPVERPLEEIATSTDTNASRRLMMPPLPEQNAESKSTTIPLHGALDSEDRPSTQERSMAFQKHSITAWLDGVDSKDRTAGSTYAAALEKDHPSRKFESNADNSTVRGQCASPARETIVQSKSSSATGRSRTRSWLPRSSGATPYRKSSATIFFR